MFDVAELMSGLDDDPKDSYLGSSIGTYGSGTLGGKKKSEIPFPQDPDKQYYRRHYPVVKDPVITYITNDDGNPLSALGLDDFDGEQLSMTQLCFIPADQKCGYGTNVLKLTENLGKCDKTLGSMIDYYNRRMFPPAIRHLWKAYRDDPLMYPRKVYVNRRTAGMRMDEERKELELKMENEVVLLQRPMYEDDAIPDCWEIRAHFIRTIDMIPQGG